MIGGIFHEGSGLGNQLFRYITTRTLALDKGLEFGMVQPEFFKGSSFMAPFIPTFERNSHTDFFTEKKVVENGVDIRSYDPEINFVEFNTIIDGEFQDERYWGHRLPEINEWLRVEPLSIPDDVCIINFRGGEYKGIPELYLRREYWYDALQEMRSINPEMKFEVHTDDPQAAYEMFSSLPDSTGINYIDNKMISHSKHTNMALNWRALRYAKYSIVSNSSFAIIPRLLRHQDGYAVTIAPHCWARHNIGVWALPQNYYKKFTYI